MQGRIHVECCSRRAGGRRWIGSIIVILGGRGKRSEVVNVDVVLRSLCDADGIVEEGLGVWLSHRHGGGRGTALPARLRRRGLGITLSLLTGSVGDIRRVIRMINTNRCGHSGGLRRRSKLLTVSVTG
jgi:hypothetical protein